MGRGKEVVGEGAEERMGREGRGEGEEEKGSRARLQLEPMLIGSAAAQKGASREARAAMRARFQLLGGDEHHHAPGSHGERRA